MTRSSTEAGTLTLPVTADDRRIAGLAALAIGLSLAEAAIPSPIPGVKPGLANLVVLVALTRYGWRTAAWVSLIRVFAASLLLGNFLAPGFWLALAGSLTSLAVLGATRALPESWIGPVGVSVLAAFGHIGGQLALAAGWLLPGAGLTVLLPVFAAAALVFGSVNGLVAARMLAAPAPNKRQSRPPCISPP